MTRQRRLRLARQVAVLIELGYCLQGEPCAPELGWRHTAIDEAPVLKGDVARVHPIAQVINRTARYALAIRDGVLATIERQK